MHNVGGMIGGDSPLSPQGEKYAAALPALVLENVGDHPLQVSKTSMSTYVPMGRGSFLHILLTRSGRVQCK